LGVRPVNGREEDEHEDAWWRLQKGTGTVVKRPAWWKFGLLGSAVLTIATVVKILKSVNKLLDNNISWSEMLVLGIRIPMAGFLCGLVVWLILPLSKALGVVGDAIVGMVTIIVFFFLCMFDYDPSLLSSRGLPMFGLAVIIGAVLGIWVGRDLRKYIAEQKATTEYRD
jgi:hypothetical protein